ncbi:hypothetical protein BC936DRAFT_145744 [Jimgerdemannia flammicorona]|uniref:Uncharacterized protein n=2 Tax=Jimgerdemannia flammicorona TaxID=994334 RepID=A0A433D994_9FUNG|nr:hypothetical protein BC936DRAFT_145744 [Jimgerdemannia flammicorona]RUS28428.1 hypothetical protein BC938DRAFT_481903 [Jimgerdemannia flammicorona]
MAPQLRSLSFPYKNISMVAIFPSHPWSFRSALDVRAWIEQNQQALLDAGKDQGAILFRGFPIMNSWGLDEFPYVVEPRLDLRLRDRFSPVTKAMCRRFDPVAFSSFDIS